MRLSASFPAKLLSRISFSSARQGPRIELRDFARLQRWQVAPCPLLVQDLVTITSLMPRTKRTNLRENKIVSSLIGFNRGLTRLTTKRFLKNGPFPASFFFIFVFSIQLTVKIVQYKFCRWLDSNRGPMVYQLSHNHCPD